eukprot:TRINITY_DN31165_c0_g3_i2.p1 TRINITY_DN31165_c0_g3~~TRINITY_DN31165_c0_g3_i2.p1  ORF type:complete len:138 (+),score=20.37 TRINITY_DN31165_c0_g3_i2:142-555(+)
MLPDGCIRNGTMIIASSACMGAGETIMAPGCYGAEARVDACSHRDAYAGAEISSLGNSSISSLPTLVESSDEESYDESSSDDDDPTPHRSSANYQALQDKVHACLQKLAAKKQLFAAEKEKEKRRVALAALPRILQL